MKRHKFKCLNVGESRFLALVGDLGEGTTHAARRSMEI
jgi:hypothetical protein